MGWIKCKEKDTKLQIKNLLTMCIERTSLSTKKFKSVHFRSYTFMFIYPFYPSLAAVWFGNIGCRMIIPISFYYITVCCCTERLQGISKWNKPYLSKTYKFHFVSLGWLKWTEMVYTLHTFNSWHIVQFYHLTWTFLVDSFSLYILSIYLTVYFIVFFWSWINFS